VDPIVAVVTLIVMLIGLLGVFVPVMPGLLVVWAASVGTTLWVGADAVGWAVAGVLTLLFGLGTAATVYLPARQGRRGGAPASSLLAALAGAVVGFFVIPVLGFLVGALGAFLVAEQLRLGEWGPAWSSTGALVRAYGIGVLVELVLGLTMIAVWAGAVILR
jgi:uncharacterized protein